MTLSQAVRDNPDAMQAVFGNEPRLKPTIDPATGKWVAATFIRFTEPNGNMADRAVPERTAS